MSGTGPERWVVLGLARPRLDWYRAVSAWATSGALPADFLKCVSAEELRARLASGRPCSAVLLDAGLPAVDRDLLASVRDAGAAPLVVDQRGGRDWAALGAAAVLPADLVRDALVDALVATATPVGPGSALTADGPVAAPDAAALAPVVLVCGPGGTGASTVAAAVAQGLGARPGADVVLADFALRAEQAVLHDARDVVPGVQELVEACRLGTPPADEVRSLTFDVVERRYALLLGLRRARAWSTVRPRALAAGLAALRTAFPTAVVCDVTADFEGEADGGSMDVEERNGLARTALAAADVALVVGRPGVKGVHALVRVVTDVVAAGLPVDRVLPVVTVAPRSPRHRAELAAAVAGLAGPALAGPLAGPLGGAPPAAGLASPVFLPFRRVESALRDAVPLPAPLPERLAGAVRAVLARSATPVAAPPGDEVPERVAPGSLGHWTDADP